MKATEIIFDFSIPTEIIKKSTHYVIASSSILFLVSFVWIMYNMEYLIAKCKCK